MNCAGLKPHYEDLKNDAKLRKADIILLAEISSMEGENQDSFRLLGYTQSLMNMGNGKGLGGYNDDTKFLSDAKLQNKKFKLAKYKQKDIDVISLYRKSETHH